MASRSLLVSGFPEGTTEADLTIYFQSRKKSGGSDIASIRLQEGRRAEITFEEEGVAQRVYSKKKHVLKGRELEIVLPSPSEGQNLKESQFATDYNRLEQQTLRIQGSKDVGSERRGAGEKGDSPANVAPGGGTPCKVRGLPKGTSKAHLISHFESCRRHAGGPVADVDIDQERGTATVIFESAEVAKRVAEFQGNMLDNHPLTVTLLNEEELEFAEEANQGADCAAAKERCLNFCVTGFSSKTTEDTLSCYLENSKRSGGGDIEDMVFYPDESFAEVSFLEVADFDRLTGGQHRLENQTFTVEVEKPKEEMPLDDRSLYVEQLNPQTDDECLTMFLEKFSDVEVEHVQLGRTGNALVTFKSPPDFDHIIDKVNNYGKGLKSFHPRVRRSPICCSVKVTGLSDQTTEETLTLHFENKRRSGGGDVDHVDYYDGSDRAIVYFKDEQVVQRVLKKEDHSLHNADLTVELYHPILEDEQPNQRRRGRRGKQAQMQKKLSIDHDIVSFVEEFHQSELDRVLQDAQVTMVKTSDSVVISSCHVKQGNGVRSAWTERVVGIEGFFNDFTKTSINLGVDVAVDVKKQMREAGLMKHEERVKITSPDPGSSSLHFIGRASHVSEAVVASQSFASGVEEDLRLKRSLTQSEDTGMPEDKLLLLEMSGYCLQLEKEKKHLKIDVDVTKGHIKYSGPEAGITEAKAQIFKFLVSAKTLVLEMPERCLSVLYTKAGRSFVHKAFQERTIVATVLPGRGGTKNEAIILGLDDKNARQAERILQTLFKEFNSPLKVGQLPVTSGQNWKELVTQIEFQSLVRVEIVSNALWVSGDSDEASRSFRQLKDFLERNAIIQEVIQMPGSCRRFLCTVWREKVDQITRQNATTWSDASEGISVSGNSANLTKCVEEIRNLVPKIECGTISIDKPGMGKFFSKKSGANLLRVVEDRHRCIIERMEVDETSGSPLPEGSAPQQEPGTTCTCTYLTPKGKKISVYKGDLTKHHVDAIVNAANDRLQHVGGLAAAVVKAGGEEIQEECDYFISRRGGPLLEGRVFVSKAGKLPCKRIIHAVGPKWDAQASTMRLEGKETKQETVLAYAIANCLDEAKSLSSIAIPAVSSGVFGFPLDLCAGVIIEAVVTFFEKNPSCRLSEVHLTNNDDRTVASFTTKMRGKFGKKGTFHEHGANRVVATSPTNITLATSRGSKAIGAKQQHLTTAEGAKISVQPGDLTSQKADVLVGSCGPSLQLSNNPCAKALSQAAGSGLQQECSTKGTVKEGNIATAGPHGLKSKAVYFGVCSSWNNGQGEKVLVNLFNKCLMGAHNGNMTSIAFSSIGTGVLGFPPGAVAKMYFDQAIAFSKKHPRTSLKDIRFIPFDKDLPTVAAFTGELSRRQSGEIGQVPSTGSTTGGRSIPSSVFSNVMERNPDHLQMEVGPQLSFQVQAGDITKEMTDAIVVVSNSELDLRRGGGAGAAILRRGGAAIQRECMAKGQQTPGSIVHTSAGNLKAKSIFHIVPTAQMNEAIVNCLQLAESNNIRSISFPAVGTGNLGMDARDCAELLLKSVEKFSQQNPTSVELVRIVIFQQDMLDDFRSVMKARSGEERHRENWVYKTVKKVVSYLPFGSDRKEISQAEMESITSADVKISLRIFAGNKLHIDGANKEIREMMDEHCKRQVIEKPAIKSLSEDHERRIRMAGLKHGTEVVIEKAVSRIEILGDLADILQVTGQIHDILDEIKEDERRRDQEEMLAKTVEWEFEESGKFRKYPKEINFRIETAYKEGKSQVPFTFEQDSYRIDFVKMEESCLSGRSVTATVRRRDVKEMAVPAHWVSQPNDPNGREKKVHLVTLSPGMPEYILVEKNFQASMKVSTIVSIERVQNPALNGIYETRKAKMDEGPKGSNEMRLFHGTARENLDKINTYGFNRNYAGAHAVVYGKGVYFALNANYSARPTYSPPDQSGRRYMYLARVLVGEFAVGKQGLLVPPSKNDSNNPTETYDTAVDQVPNPQIFVTFYDWQCYPEYLITFQ